MEWNKETRIAAIVSAGLVMVALFGFSVLSGAKIDAVEVLKTLLDVVPYIGGGTAIGMAISAGKAKS